MKIPPIPVNERNRLAALRRYGLHRHIHAQVFQDIAALAAKICGAPQSLVNIIDEDTQWFLGSYGVDEAVLGRRREHSICSHTIMAPGLNEIPDTHADPLFQDDMLCGLPPSLRFYAGYSLRTPEDLPIGVLCVFGYTPHRLDAWQREALAQLAQLTMALIESIRIQDDSLLFERRGQELAQLVDAVSEGVLTLDRQGIILSANPAAAQLTGRPAADLVGQPIGLLLEWEGSGASPVSLTLSDGRLRHCRDLHLVRAGAGRVSVDAICLPLKDAGGQSGAIVTLRDITEERHAELQLATQQAEVVRAHRALAEIMHNSLDLICTIDAEGRFREVSDASARLLGYTPEDLYGRNFLEIVAPVDQDRSLATNRSLMTGGEPVQDFENHVIRKDGSLVEMAWSCTPLTAEGIIYCVGRDISERRLAERLLTEANRRTTDILESISDAFFAIDRDWRFTYINQMAEAFSPYPPGEIIGKSFMEALPGIEDTVFVQKYREALERNEAVAFEAFSEHFQRWFDVKAYPHPEGLSVFFRDVTEAHAIRRALQDSEQRLRLIFESAADGIAQTTLDGRWLHVNPQLCRMLGYSHEELLGMTFKDVTHPDDLAGNLDGVRALLAGEVSRYSTEKRYLRKDGSFLWARLTVSVSQDEEGRPEYLIALISDISEQKRLEQDLRIVQQDFQLLVEGTTDYAMIMLDAKGLILRWNHGARRIFGFNETEILCHSAVEIYPGEHLDLQKLLAAVRRAGRREAEGWLSRKDGMRFWAHATLTALYDDKQALRGYSLILKDQTERRRQEEKTAWLATHDPLTGLLNRAAFSTSLAERIADGNAFGVLLLDLDRFKSVNDTLGHDVGDWLLQEVARRIRRTIGLSDLAARLGGDEFVVLAGLRPPAVEALAARLVEVLNQPYVLDGKDITSGGSVGGACFPEHATEASLLLKRADQAMYEVKATGRRNYLIFSEAMLQGRRERDRREADLRAALAAGGFELVYQPQLAPADGRVLGVEALLRWPQPDGTLLLPDDFLPVAEEANLLPALGAWVLEAACSQWRCWQEAGLPAVRLSVNVAAQQLLDPAFCKSVQQTLIRHKMPPAMLSLELGAGVLGLPGSAIRQQISALAELGVGLIMDDFGEDLAHLDAVGDYPVQTVKVGRRLVAQLPQIRQARAVLHAMVTLIRELGLIWAAEGVERADQLTLLQELGCPQVQGCYFSPPLSPAALADRLRPTLPSAVGLH